MDLFKKLFGKKENDPPLTGEEAFLEAARLISNDNSEAVEAVRYRLNHYEEFFAERISDFACRGLSGDSEKGEVCLIAMIEVLIDFGCLREFDRLDDSDEVLSGLRLLAEKLRLDYIPQMDLSFLDDGETVEDLEPERVFTLVAVNIDRYHQVVARLAIHGDSYIIGLMAFKAFQKCEAALRGVGWEMQSY